MNDFVAIVLAAGEGKRMKSKLPKPLLLVCGKPMIAHVLDEIEVIGPQRVVVVIGSRREQMTAALAQRDVEFVVQDPQLGTGHAVQCAEPALSGFAGDVLITCADIPLLRARTMAELLGAHRREKASATILSAVLDDPTGYGRLVRDDSGNIVAIVEERDADEHARAIKEVNMGVYVFSAARLFEALATVEPNNVQGEYYLTDVVEVMAGWQDKVISVPTDDPEEVMGVNDRAQLARAEAVARDRVRQRLMQDGVSMIDPSSVFIDADVVVGRDTVIWPGTHILGQSRIGEDCTIGPNAYIESSQIGDGSAVAAGAVVRASVVGNNCSLGPHCHVRDSSTLADGVRVGTSTEVVRSRLASGVRALHFCYLGDAEVGEGANIGAGCVTCNYDGRRKNPTVIESGAFIGSDAILVAPVRIGEGAYVAAGSVITKDVPPGALAIARERQIVREGWARRRFGAKDA